MFVCLFRVCQGCPGSVEFLATLRLDGHHGHLYMLAITMPRWWRCCRQWAATSVRPDCAQEALIASNVAAIRRLGRNVS